MRDQPFDGLFRVPRRKIGAGRTTASTASTDDRAYPGAGEHMLLQDLSTWALPYGSGSDRGFDASIKPADSRAAKLIHDAIPSTTYRHGRLADSVRNYIDSAMWYLIDGDLYLEVQYFEAAEGAGGAPVAFCVELIEPGRLAKRWGRYEYQVRNNDRFGEQHGWSVERLAPECLVAASLPRELRRTFDRARDLIRQADRDMGVASGFLMGRNGSDTGFDFGAYRRLSTDLVLRGTRSIGWAERGILTEGLLDPEKAWRAIQFARFAVRLRDVAMQALNEAIRRAGSELGFDAAIQLARVRTVSELDELEQELAAGTRPIADLLVPWLRRNAGD